MKGFAIESGEMGRRRRKKGEARYCRGQRKKKKGRIVRVSFSSLGSWSEQKKLGAGAVTRWARGETKKRKHLHNKETALVQRSGR